jgi:CBS domain-containing protein
MTANSRSILQRNFIQIPLKSLSLKEAFSVKPSTSVAECLAIMASNNYGCLLIHSDDNKIIGLISERDVLKKSLTKDGKFGTAPVSEFMTKDPQTLKANLSIARALHLMSVGGFRHIPVVPATSGKSLIFTSTDLFSYIYQQLTSKIEKDQNFLFDKNSVDQFFLSNLSILSPTPAVLAQSTDSVETALNLMSKNNQGACLITDSNSRILGIFTERDFLRKIAAKSGSSLKIQLQEIMTTSPETLHPSASVAYAFNIMVNKGFRHLPIVNEEEKVTGVLSVKNFINYISAQILEELQK